MPIYDERESHFCRRCLFGTQKIAEELGIPTFELGVVECLMDWRLETVER